MFLAFRLAMPNTSKTKSDTHKQKISHHLDQICAVVVILLFMHALCCYKGVEGKADVV